METWDPTRDRLFAQRHPVATYFLLTYAVSWMGALLVAAPSLVRGHPVPKMTGALMFPAMLLGPSAVGIILTRVVDGRIGLKELLSRMGCIRVRANWYATLLIPPALIVTVLACLRNFVSPVFAPNVFMIGAMFGFTAGFFEEIGWMGYAFPKMRKTRSPFAAAVILGIFWSTWHLPVIDFLGAATPHAAYWVNYFLAFAAAMTAIRVLIGWIYSNTNSVLLCQAFHASSTGSLVVFSPARVTAAQEALWYAVYAGALWTVVALVAVISRRHLVNRRAHV